MMLFTLSPVDFQHVTNIMLTWTSKKYGLDIPRSYATVKSKHYLTTPVTDRWISLLFMLNKTILMYKDNNSLLVFIHHEIFILFSHIQIMKIFNKQPGS